MSESVSLPSEELPDEVELALLVRAIWRVLPMLPWSDAAEHSGSGVEPGNLGSALLATTMLTLHSVDPGCVEVEMRQLAGELSAASPLNSEQSVLFGLLLRAVNFAMGESTRVPGIDDAAQLEALYGSEAESMLAQHAYAEDRALIAMEGRALAKAGEQYGRALMAGRLWPAIPETAVRLRDGLHAWHQTLTAQGRGWLWAIYNEWMQGNALDWRRLEAYVHDWYESHLLDKVEPDAGEPAQIGNATVKQSDPEVDGGIVTAAADEPCAEDRLGRKPLVDTLADMLASPQQSLPMTIALLGAWGAGKSSVILQLRQQLTEFNRYEDRAHYHFAEFNAWEYEHTDNIRAGLAHEVVRGLTADMSGWQKMRLALNNAHRQHGMELYGLVGALALAGVALCLGLTTTRGASGSIAQAGGLGVFGFGAWLAVNAFRNGKKLLAHPLASQLKTYLQLPSYGRHLGEVPVIRQEIEGLCAERLGGQRGSGVEQRLLVVVDDLDRCQPECITACLDAVRLVMSLPHIAVIIAVDDRIAFQAVAAHYAGLARDGSRSKEAIARDYLGKIIQLPVNLYQPWPQEVAAFVSEQLFTVAGPDESLEPGGDLNEQSGGLPVAGTVANAAARGAGSVIQGGPPDNRDSLTASTDLPPRNSAGVPLADQAADQASEQAADARPADPDRVQPATSGRQDARVRQRQMRDQLFEQELFIELAGLAQFSNPRQLIRLRNGYRLLKGYTLNRRGKRGMARQDCERLLLGLFWYEYLYQREPGERREQELLAWESFEPLGLDDAAKSRADDRRLHAAESSQAMIKRLAQCLGEQDWYQGYPNMLRTVQMAVLPNADLGLLLTLDEAKAAAGDAEQDGS